VKFVSTRPTILAHLNDADAHAGISVAGATLRALNLSIDAAVIQDVMHPNPAV
jgi:hypothetical protein